MSVWYACSNTCAYGTIAKIWDEISPGWLKGPLSRGLPFCGNPFLTYLSSSFTSTPATTYSLCLFFLYIYFISTQISLMCAILKHTVCCELSDKHEHFLFMIHRMTQSALSLPLSLLSCILVHLNELTQLTPMAEVARNTQGTCLLFLAACNPKTSSL